MIIETVRVSEKAKNQLMTLKRRTGIQNWNVLCRWALMMSLAENTVPPAEEIQTDSSIEMSWKTFAGALDDVISVVVRERAHRDGVASDELQDFFKIHLHRGIAYLMNSNEDLLSFFSQLPETPHAPAGGGRR